MGININCDEESFCCTYSTWAEIRHNVIIQTNNYLIDYFSSNTFDSEENPNEKIDREEILNYMKKILINPNVFSYVDIMINITNMDHVNLLILYDIIGVYSLCNKSDCEGYYSVGDSYNICQLFNLIKPFLFKNKENIKNGDYIYDAILDIEKIFQESVNKHIKVIIS